MVFKIIIKNNNIQTVQLLIEENTRFKPSSIIKKAIMIIRYLLSYCFKTKSIVILLSKSLAILNMTRNLMNNHTKLKPQNKKK